MIGQFGEDAVKVFAAELGSALGNYLKVDCLSVLFLQSGASICFGGFFSHIAGFLHDFGIIHRDVKVSTFLSHMYVEMTS